MEKILSCDWGTSSFRLRLVQPGTQTIVQELSTTQGIAATHKQWQNEGNKDNRIAFYRSVMETHIKALEEQLGEALTGLPIVFSGMISSSVGMIELPYKELPFLADGSDLLVTKIEALPDFPHDLVIISGATTGKDVLRGEETLLAGCGIIKTNTEQLFIFPGTHSKHIRVKNGWAKDFKTYMTGEVFDLLSNKSILAGAVEKDPVELPASGNSHFDEGIHEGAAANLLNSFFNVRTSQLFNKRKPKENYHYLSGLLIGAELKSIAEKPPASITLVCDEKIKNSYCRGLQLLRLNSDILTWKNAAETLVSGQLKICSGLFIL